MSSQTNVKSFARILRERRQELRLPQTRVAARAGISQPYYSQLELDLASVSPRIDDIVALAAALELDLDELIEPFRQRHSRRPLKAAS